MDLILDEFKHTYWDEFLTELNALCKKHHVIFETTADSEIIAIDNEKAYKRLNLGYAVTAKNIEDMLKS